MIVSVHISKTAGSSFRALLQQQFRKRLFLDYWRRLDSVPCDFDKTKYDCIHGHFQASKYLPKEQNVFITWMRNPLDRAISHYNYLQRNSHPNREKHERPPWAKRHDFFDKEHETIITENWSLEKFLMHEDYRNFCSNKFLYEVSLDMFDFIGITEYFDADCAFFCKRFLGRAPKLTPKINVDPNRMDCSLSDSFRSEFTDFHSEDYNIYNKALELRADRLKQLK